MVSVWCLFPCRSIRHRSFITNGNKHAVSILGSSRILNMNYFWRTLFGPTRYYKIWTLLYCYLSWHEITHVDLTAIIAYYICYLHSMRSMYILMVCIELHSYLCYAQTCVLLSYLPVTLSATVTSL